ncbi:MAG: glycosyltransferase family 2 protein [Paracoccaceae bacterium]
MSAPLVTVVMATRNGAPYLGEQLDSLERQSHATWRLMVSDDGSDDGTWTLLEAFQARIGAGRVTLGRGPQRGVAANFLSLIAAVGPQTAAVALADQDDVWLPEKLARGMAAMAGREGPVLYCARTRIVGPALQERGLSAAWTRPFGFANALVQNVAAGNTILLNRAATDLARAAIRRMPAAVAEGIVLHDWWLYQLVTGAGGMVLHDGEPVLLYRQHGQNLIGGNQGTLAKLRRLGMVLTGTFRDWNGRNIAALSAAGDLLSPHARTQLAGFAALRQAGLAGRLRGLARSGLYRQTRAGQAALWVSALLGRI